MSRYLSPKGGYYWSDADWVESIDNLANQLPDFERKFYSDMARSYIDLGKGTELKYLYSTLLKVVMNHKFPM
jgi:hypothetical protein